MELEPGFQLTEAGPIPEDWEAVRLSKASEIITGRTPPAAISGAFGYDVPFVTPADLGRASVILETQRCLSPLGAALVPVAPPDSTLFVCIGSTIGKVGRAGRDVAFNQQINAAIAGDETCQLFLSHRLASDAERIAALAGEQAVPILNKTQFGEAAIARPPLPEQRAIAAVLETANAWIAAAEAEAAKLESVKAAAMDALLTPTARLPGFSGEWSTATLSELGEVTGSGVDKKSREGERAVRLLNYMDVYRSSHIYGWHVVQEVTAKPDQLTRCSVLAGDVFFTPSSEVPEDIAAAGVAMCDVPSGVYSYHLVRLRPKLGLLDHSFSGFAFRHSRVKRQAEQLCGGSGTRYVLSLEQFRMIEVALPPTLAEQSAIATVLSDIDTALAAARAVVAKARSVKAAAMDVLLSGRVRLPGFGPTAHRASAGALEAA